MAYAPPPRTQIFVVSSEEMVKATGNVAFPRIHQEPAAAGFVAGLWWSHSNQARAVAVPDPVENYPKMKSTGEPTIP